MRRTLLVGGVVGLGIAAAAVVAVATLPAQADPKPAEVVSIGKVHGSPEEVRKQLQEGHLVPVQPSDPTFDPEPTTLPQGSH